MFIVTVIDLIVRHLDAWKRNLHALFVILGNKILKV